MNIQRNPANGPFITTWLAHPNVQVQFFAAQCLLIRINRDWDTLEEEEQVQLQRIVSSALGQDNLTAAARNKLHESLVKVMEKAFLSGWWKDPLGDLLKEEKGVHFNLIALVPILCTQENNTKSSYAWHHEIKSHSDQVINCILAASAPTTNILDCIKNWTAFGAFNFGQVQKLLPGLLAALDDETEAVVDCLVEICELPVKDPADEAKKANCLLPTCLRLAGTPDIDEATITKLTASLAEECASFLINSCHSPETRSFLALLLRLTSTPGVVGTDEFSSEKTLNAWYLLTEAVDSDLPAASKKLLIELFGNSLVPILLTKATLPPPQIWSKIQRDLQQQFLQIRREFLDSLLYIQRALAILEAPSLLLNIIYGDLKQLAVPGLIANSKAHVEIRLRALMIVAEESDSGEESTWTDAWQNLISLIFTSPDLTKDPINTKLAIFLIGFLVPLMKDQPTTANDAVKMLLAQLQQNPLVREECLGALQQAADAEIPLLTDPQIITALLDLLATWDPGTRSQLLRLLSRLVADLEGEAQRWEAFNALIQASMALQDYRDLAQCLRTPFSFASIPVNGSSAYATCLAQLKQKTSLPTGEALLAAWTALSGSSAFPLFEGHHDPWPFIESFLKKSAEDPAFLVLGSKLLSTWVYGMSRVDPSNCIRLLETITSLCILPSASSSFEAPEDAIEAILDAWIHCIKQKVNVPVSTLLGKLYNWTLERISLGQLSVPLLRSLARFICIQLEYGNINTPEQIYALLEVIVKVGVSGRIGRSGMEILARPAHDASLLHPDTFRSALNQILLNGNGSEEFPANLTDRRAFLRNLGAAHTIKKFKTVLVDFCLTTRGIN